MLDDLIGKYEWVTSIDAWTVAVVEGPDADEVVRIYGADPADSVGRFSFGGAFGLQGDDYNNLKFHIQILDSARHVVVLENNGWAGSVPEIARRCSAEGGTFFSVYWNVNAFGKVTQAIDGRVTAYFESLFPFESDTDPPTTIRPPWARGPRTTPGLAFQVCLALMEQQTGLAFDRRWLERSLPTYWVPDPGLLFQDVENAWLP